MTEGRNSEEGTGSRPMPMPKRGAAQLHSKVRQRLGVSDAAPAAPHG